LFASSPFTIQILAEIQNTKQLLYPLGDSISDAYLKELGEKRTIDPTFVEATSVDAPRCIHVFEIWDTKLRILNDEYQMQNVGRLGLLLTDTRNKQQYITFLIALIVFLLTMFFGIFSIILSYRQIEIGNIQIQLARR